ncbi:MAG TPA: PDZ domain-containing protein [Blastocatellia bacterium]|nr:PDZ domain-containing protein [Blastocatellia bacterium]
MSILGTGALAQMPERPLRTALPPGQVYVTRKIDLRQQLSAEETIFSLDGEPIPQLQTTSVTLGLVIDQEGHIVTRLADFSPQETPPQLTVYLVGERPGQFQATFIGMDSVTGLCVLKADKLPASFPPATSKAAVTQMTQPLQRLVQLYGFNPKQRGIGMPGVTMFRPRIYNSTGIIKRATEDFRYTPNNPIYYLNAPTTLTPVQDCSAVADKDSSVIGLVLYDTNGEGNHLVYPLSRIQAIAAMILEQKRFVLPHAWLGATSGGHDPGALAPNKLTPAERGVLIAQVFPDSPAEMAGIRPNDMLVSISGRTLVTGADLSSTLRLLTAGSDVTLKVRRGNEFKLLPARLAPAPAMDAKQQLKWVVSQMEHCERLAQQLPETDPDRSKNQSKANTYRSILNGIINPAPPEIWLRLMYGVEVTALTPQLSKAFSAPGGVLVSSLNTTGKAVQAGLKVGDIVVKIGEQGVVDEASFMQLLSREKGDTIELHILRDKQFVTLTLSR